MAKYNPNLVRENIERLQEKFALTGFTREDAERHKRIVAKTEPFLRETLQPVLFNLNLRSEDLKEFLEYGCRKYIATSILDLTESNIQDMRVMDLGCGSPLQQTYFSEQFPPFYAELLTHLGAHVTGVDYRRNPFATYEHKTLDLFKTPQKELEASLQGDYNLILATGLGGGGLVNAKDETHEEETLREIIQFLSRKDQILITQIDAKGLGYTEVPLAISKTFFRSS